MNTVQMQTEVFSLTEPALVRDKLAMGPDVAVDAFGRAWVVWYDHGRAGDRIRLGRVDDPEEAIYDLSERPGVAFQPAVAAIPGGGLYIVWTIFRETAWSIVGRSFDGETLGAEAVIVTSEEGVFHPRLVVDAAGACWLACERVTDREPRLVSCVLRNGRWSSPAPVDAPSGACYRPALAARADGSVWAAYDVYADGRYSVYLQRIDRPVAPLPVANDGYQNLQASLAADADGYLWVAWAGNANEAYRDPWWLTKYVNLRRFDGASFGDPTGPQPDRDLYNEDAFQGWEFPEVTVDVAGRVWLFGQAAHTLYAQYYAEGGWSPRYTIAPRRWGCWKPRVRSAGAGPIFLASMGLQGAQVQRLEIAPEKQILRVTAAFEPKPAVRHLPKKRDRPVITSPDGERLHVYFGDLHAHSVYTDAMNDVDELYHRYRDAYGYDFAALTDHDFLDGIELTPSELKMMWNHCDRMTEPGAFVAMYGYEWTSPAISVHAAEGDPVGEGHRHVLYLDQTGPLISYGEASANTGKKLLERLKGLRALIIPHHTAWSGTDWDAHDDELQRLVEICSTHGRFEYTGNKPIGYRRDHLHPDKFVLAGLDRGYRLGFVGGSDSHGLRWHAIELEGRAAHIAEGTRVGWKEDAYRTGMTAILAPELTREALFDALYRRRCYATSGEKIELDFRVNDQLMGSEVATEGPPVIRATVRGTAGIRSVEVIRSGHLFAAMHSQPGEAIPSMSIQMEDTMLIPGEPHYYYLRVTQEDGNMAWSSPVWVVSLP